VVARLRRPSPRGSIRRCASLRPGGYDFSSDLYFQRVGATGFVTGAIRIAEPPVPPSAWVRYATPR